MTDQERFDSAWGRGASDTLRDLASWMVACGRLGCLEVRRARLLSRSEGSLMLLLLLQASLRSKAPRVAGRKLREILEGIAEDPRIQELAPDEVARLTESVKSSVPAWLALWDATSRDAAVDPGRVASWCTGPRGDLSLVECEVDGDLHWAFSLQARAEDALIASVLRRLETPLDEVPVATARRILFDVCGAANQGGILDHLQARAVAMALRSRFLVVSGGPGTGKTTVVVRILRALSRLEPDLVPERIALTASTGRAQARLAESVRRSIDLPGGEPRDAALAGVEAQTIHSLLGARPDGTFRHGPKSPLPHDLVVVDEVSMVDLVLFDALLQALRPEARLVLLGDRNQLPSVDAGSVLADLVGGRDESPLGPGMFRWIGDALEGVPCSGRPGEPDGSGHPLADRLVVLRHSFRSVPAIAEAASSVLSGDELWPDRIECVFPGEVRRNPELPVARTEGDPGRAALDWAGGAWGRDWEGGVGRMESGGSLREWLERSRILCAVHAGPAGRERIVPIVDEFCRERAGYREGAGHYPGRQLICPRNRRDLGINNGEIGVVLRREDRWMVAFESGGRRLWIEPESAPELEPAWAITVHKAQGSEFDEVLFFLPANGGDFVDRPLVYTAITRARRRMVVWGSPADLRSAIARTPDRPSRLRRALFGGSAAPG